MSAIFPSIAIESIRIRFQQLEQLVKHAEEFVRAKEKRPGDGYSDSEVLAIDKLDKLISDCMMICCERLENNAATHTGMIFDNAFTDFERLSNRVFKIKVSSVKRDLVIGE